MTGIWKTFYIFTLLILFSLTTHDLYSFQAGEEFQVNNNTNDIQHSPDVAMDAKGNFVITWNSDSLDGTDSEVFAKVFQK